MHFHGTAPIPQLVKQSQLPLGKVDWDVVVSGGTLGILIGCALTSLGWRVALIERGSGSPRWRDGGSWEAVQIL